MFPTEEYLVKEKISRMIEDSRLNYFVASQQTTKNKVFLFKWKSLILIFQR